MMKNERNVVKKFMKMLLAVCASLILNGVSIQAQVQDAILYGSKIRLRHAATGKYLTGGSDAKGGRYSHPRSSKQHVVFGAAEKGDDTLWIVKGAHKDGDRLNCQPGGLIKKGSTIRFENAATGFNLHAHNLPSPVTRQGEVTSYGSQGIGDSNDNWNVFELSEGREYLSNGITTKFMHSNVRRTLHSHPNLLNQANGWHEVTTYGNRDNNDWFVPELVEPFVDKVAQEQVAQAAKEQAEKERLVKEQAEQAAKAAQEQAAREQAERLAKEQAEKEKIAKEQAAQAAREQAEKERIAKEQAEQAARQETERLAKEKAAREQAEKAAQAAKEQAEKERIAKEQAAKEQAARVEAERLAKEQAEKERIAKERAARVEAERLAKEQAEKARIAQEQAAKAAQEAKKQAEKDRLEKEQAAQEKAAEEQATARERAKRAAIADKVSVIATQEQINAMNSLDGIATQKHKNKKKQKNAHKKIHQTKNKKHKKA